MNKSVNSNIYGYALDSMWDCYGDFLSGNRQAIVCVVSEFPVGEQAREAFEKSFAKLGYGDNACTFLVLTGIDSSSGLGAQDIFSIIEGLDPLVVVAADARATEALGRAYRTGFDTGKRARLLGRSAVAFPSFEAMLATSEAKQKAWATLKLLAREQ